jgi:hypothetical protein
MAKINTDVQLAALLNALTGLDAPVELDAQIEIPVAVTYKDGRRVAVSVKITVTAEDERDPAAFAGAIQAALQATGLHAEGA